MRLVLLLLLFLPGAVHASWSQSEPISPGTNPSAIQDSNGTYWVAYTYWVEGPQETNIDVYLRASSDGKNWSEPVRVTDHSKSDSDPSLIQDADGVYRILFTSSREGQDSIFITSSRDGTGWSEPRRAIPAGIDGSYPNLMQDSNGTFWATFSWYENGRSSIFITSSRDGTGWSEPSRITDPSGAATFSKLVEKDGGYWLVYAMHEGPLNHLYLISSKDGRAWSRPVRLTPFEAKNNYPALLADARGALWLAFTSTVTGAEELLITGSQDGVAWSAPIQLTNNTREGRGGKTDYKSMLQARDGRYWLFFRSGGLRGMVGENISLAGAPIRLPALEMPSLPMASTGKEGSAPERSRLPLLFSVFLTLFALGLLWKGRRKR